MTAGDPRLPSPPIGPGRRLAAGVVALGVFTAAAAFAWSALRRIGDDGDPTVRASVSIVPTASASVLAEPSVAPPSKATDDPWGWFDGEVAELPPPPVLRCSDVRVWTGSQLVVWGGHESCTGDPPHRNDGWVFDAASRAWSKLPPSPLSPRSFIDGVWTGSEVVIWGGGEGSWPGERQLGDGASYDPASKTWEMLPPASIDTFSPLASVWTGTEAIFWGSAQGDGVGPGLAFDAVAGTWRTLPPAPVPMQDSVTAAWTGQEMLVFGGAGRMSHPNVAAYDPAADAWRILPGGGLDGNAVAIGSTGIGVVAADYNKRAATFTGEGWAALPDLSTDSCEGYPSVPTVTADAAVVALCGDLGYVTSDDARWRRALTDVGIASVYAGAGDVVLVVAYDDDRELEERSASLLAFRPLPGAAKVSIHDAMDLAIAFASLRSHYPFDTGVPDHVAAQMRGLLAPQAETAWFGAGMRALWDYYPGFEVVAVEPLPHDRFEARLELTLYSGGTYHETITMAPGMDVDGIERDLVIVDARPG